MQAQTVYYYQLTKTKINDIVSTQNKGGQFICIYDDFCFDCDKNGNITESIAKYNIDIIYLFRMNTINCFFIIFPPHFHNNNFQLYHLLILL
mgnify:CR=1 FL=1